MKPSGFLMTLLGQLDPAMRQPILQLWKYIAPSFTPEVSVNWYFHTDLLRGADQLGLQLHFYNLKLSPPEPGQPPMVHGMFNAMPVVVAIFPPQSFGERSFFETDDHIPLPPSDPEYENGGIKPSERPVIPPVAIRTAGMSWLVLQIPYTALPFPYTVAGVLSILKAGLPITSSTWERPEGPLGLKQSFVLPWDVKTDPLGRPSRLFTALELPYHLVLSPDANGNWDHALNPITHQSPTNDPQHPKTRTELWHTRLTSSAPLSGRFVWSPDMDYGGLSLPNHNNLPFRMSMDANDRYQLVRLTSDLQVPEMQRHPVALDSVALSLLGGWLKGQGDWEAGINLPIPSEPPTNVQSSLIEWQHILNLGRDQFVKVVTAGFLYPFGHPAALIKITERKFNQPTYQDNTINITGAYLRTRMFIILRQPFTLNYSDRQLPFTTLTVLTRLTPNLVDPNSMPADAPNGIVKQYAFWPCTLDANGQPTPFHFSFTALDWDGQPAEFTAPAIFVEDTINSLQDDMKNVANTYAAESTDKARVAFGGQRIAFLPSWQTGDTSYDVAALTFGNLDGPGDPSQPAPQPSFHPVMRFADLDLPAVRSLLGVDTPVTVEWEPTYTAASSDMGNLGEVFLKVKNPPRLTFDPTRSGGLAAPNITISGLSRAYGPVDATTQAQLGNGSNLGSLLDGKFAPQIFDPSVTIMGDIPLQNLFNILDAVPASPFIPALKYLTNPDGSTTTSYAWKVEGAAAFFSGTIPGGPIFEPGGNACLELAVTLVRPAAPGAALQASVSGSLSDVAITLSPAVMKLVKVEINRLSFTSVTGSKPDFSVDMSDFVFLGPLTLLNELAHFLPKDGFKDPPNVTVDASGATVGYTLGLPSLGVGMFTLQNISLSASFFLPFGAQKSNLHLAFCERHQPFLLTVMGLGGGGFVGLDIGMSGLKQLETSLEFGASVAINLGVAAGSVSITGGIYMQLVGGGFKFAAFFRAAGELSVLGLISASLEFYMGLEYADKNAGGGYSSLRGVATLTVEIDILFFSISVDVTMERTFAGSDPTFAQLMDQNGWDAYCEAFV